MDIIDYLASKKYTDEALIGGGAIKGKNCTIETIVHKEKEDIVTFKWFLDDGTVQRQEMVVKNGVSPTITVKENTPSRYVLHIKSGDTEWDTPNLRGGGGSGTSDYDALDNRPQINGVTLEGNKTSEDLKLDKFRASYDEENEKVTIQV